MAYQQRDVEVRYLGNPNGLVNANDKVQTSNKKTSTSLQDFADTSKKTALVFGAIGAGLMLYAKNATDYTVELTRNSKELSRNTGQTIEDSSRLLYVTQRLGLSADQTSTTFGIFSKKIKEAQDSADPAASTLGKLDINVRNTDGSFKSFNQVLLDTADKFKGMSDGSQKTALAMELFGRSGKDMIPVLNQGSKGIQDLEKRADDLGLTLNAKTVASVTKYITAQKNLTDSTNALKVQVGSLTAPVLANFYGGINDVVSALISSKNPFRELTANVLAFGGPVASGIAGLTGFASGLAQLVETAGGFSALMKGITAFMGGPWILGLTLAAGAVTTLMGMFVQASQSSDSFANSTDRLTQAQNDLTDALKASDDATEALKDAQFNQEGANLRVESAQRQYNEAVKQYGPASLEARQAMHDLRGAQKDAADAAKNTNDKLEDQKNKINAVKIAQDNMNKAKAADVQAQNERASAIANQANQWNNLAEKMDKVYQARMKGDPTGGGGAKNGQFQIPLSLSLGKRAKGGPVKAGESYFVGEEGIEIFTPTKDGTIIPNHELGGTGRTAVSDAGPAMGGGTTIHFDPTIQIGMFAGMPMEFREIAERLWVEFTRMAQANGYSLPSIGVRTQ